MRLLQINVTANWGSTGRIAEEIGRMAMAQGWESWIAYGRGKPQSQSHLIRIGNDWDMKLHAVETRLFDNHGLASCRATKQFIKQAENIKPDVIHLHNIHGYYINYKILFDYLRRWGGPVVWTLHDCWTFTGHCAFYNHVGCTRWQSGCGGCRHLSTYPSSLWRDRSRQNWLDKREAFSGLTNLTLVPVSDWLRGEVEKSFLGGYPVKVIHNGIDLTTFRPVSRRFKVLGVASVWDERKGLADFICLRRLLPIQEVDIVIVGLSKAQIETLPPGITGMRRIADAGRLAAIYSEADVFVNPTYADTYPTTNLEAMACGTPVVTYRTDGSPESVSDATGRVVDAGDVGAVARIVNDMRFGRLAFDRAEMSRWVETHFSKSDRYSEYIAKYAEIHCINRGGVNVT